MFLMMTEVCGSLVTSPSRKRFETADAITPVPVGAGRMTIACLLSNTIDVATSRRDCPRHPAPQIAAT